MNMFMKFSLSIAMLVLAGGKATAMPSRHTSKLSSATMIKSVLAEAVTLTLYTVKLPVPHSDKIIAVPISLQLLEREPPSDTNFKERLQFALQEAFNSAHPLLHHALSKRIAFTKNSLRGHVKVFDDDLLSDRANSAAKLRMNYSQMTLFYDDIIRSLQESEEFQQAFEVSSEDLRLAGEVEVSIQEYEDALNREAASGYDNLDLVDRLLTARLKAVVSSGREELRRELSQNFAVLDIARQNAETGSYLALRFAFLHNLYQQQINLHLPLAEQFDEQNRLKRELRSHQAREEFSRTVYLLLNKS